MTSDTHIPDSPCRWNLKGLRSSAPAEEKLDLTSDLFEIRLAMALGELLFGIKEVHLARTTVHEKVDHGFGLRFIERLARFEVVDATPLTPLAGEQISP